MRINRRSFLSTTTATALSLSAGGCGSPSGETKEQDPTKEVRVSATVVAKIDNPGKELTALAISPDGKQLVAGWADGSVRCWTLEDGKPDQRLKELDRKPEVAFIGSPAWSPDGKLVAALASPSAVAKAGDTRLRIWDAATGKEVSHKIPSNGFALAFIPPGPTLVIAGKTVQFWDVRASQKLRELPLEPEEKSIWKFAISPDGSRMAASYWGKGPKQDEGDPLVHAWDAKTGQKVLSGWKLRKTPQALVFSPDGSLLAAAGEKENIGEPIQVWDLYRADEPWQPEEKATDVVGSLAFALGGDVLLSGNNDGTIHAWDWKGKKVASTFKEHPSRVTHLALSKDGMIVASGSRSRIVVWRLERK